MKKIRVLALVLTAIMLVGVFAACGPGRNRKVVGKWVEIDDDGDEGEVYTFARNGKGSVQGDGMSGDMTWSTEKDVLTMSLSMCGMSETREVKFKIVGRTMIWFDIDDGTEVARLKKK